MSVRWDAILFDMDGTLIDVNMKEFLNEYFVLWQEVVAKYTDKSGEFVQRLLLGTDEMAKSTNPKLTNEEVFWEAFSDSFWSAKIYRPISDRFYDNEFLKLESLVSPRPGMVDLVEGLHGKVKLALATNSVFPKKAILSRLHWGGLSEVYFDFIACFETMHYCKPRLQYFQEIADDLEVDPKRCLMVGDDPKLDLVAKNLGMETFFFDSASGQNASWQGEAIHVVSENDRKFARETADCYGDLKVLEEFIMAGLESNLENN